MPSFQAIVNIDAPTLMVTAHSDEMPGSDADVARSILGIVGGPTESLELDGGHFGLLYPGTPEFVASVQAQRDFPDTAPPAVERRL